MGARHSIKNPKDREGMTVKTEEPSKLGPERSKTDVNYNATVQHPTGEGNEKLESPFDSLVKIGERKSNINKGSDANKAATTNKRAQLPYYLNEILKEADSPPEINKSSIDRLYGQLYNGVHLKQNKQKYWIDRTYAEDLSITWGGEDCYWNWIDITETEVKKKVQHQ